VLSLFVLIFDGDWIYLSHYTSLHRFLSYDLAYTIIHNVPSYLLEIHSRNFQYLWTFRRNYIVNYKKQILAQIQILDAIRRCISFPIDCGSGYWNCPWYEIKYFARRLIAMAWVWEHQFRDSYFLSLAHAEVNL